MNDVGRYMCLDTKSRLEVKTNAKIDIQKRLIETNLLNTFQYWIGIKVIKRLSNICS